jgi:DNA-binding transcriptional LysR family regulator
MQIKELENELGTELVERRAGEIALTDVGIEVVRRAERVLSEARDLQDFARHRGQLLSGRLQFGVIPSLAPYVLPKVLPELQRRFPDLQIELRETQTRILLDELTRGALDVVMLALPVQDAELETREIFQDPFLLAVPATDCRRDGARVTAEDIDQKRLILLEEGHCLRDQALALCASERRDQPRDGDPDGGEWLRRHAAAEGGGRRRAARRPRQAVALLRPGAGPHGRARLAAYLAAQGGLRRARRHHRRDAEGTVTLRGLRQ